MYTSIPDIPSTGVKQMFFPLTFQQKQTRSGWCMLLTTIYQFMSKLIYSPTKYEVEYKIRE
jgi:hypothetical protein